jgi:hypothetical protein
MWRPALKNCPSKHYHPAANRALPAVIIGMTGEVGEINGQRLALPRAFERLHPKDTSEKRLWQELLENAKESLAKDEIVVVEAGVKISILQEFEIERYEVRLATNFTARRNFLPAHCKDASQPTEPWYVRCHASTRAKLWTQLLQAKSIPGSRTETNSAQRFGAIWF